jgi:putative ABC transport system permease protein
MIINLLKLAWRNIWRNKRRTFLTLTAIVVGVFSIIFAKSYIAGILSGASNTIVRTQIGHVRIVNSEYLRLERILPKEYLVNDTAQLHREISQLEGIDSIIKRIKFNVLLSHGNNTEAAVAVGINPEMSDKFLELSKSIVEGEYLSESGLNLIIGKKLARELKVTVGEELLLVTTDINYSTYALPFTVSGIFETGYSAFDKHLLYMPLKKAQEMLDCGDSLHEILIYLNDPGRSFEVIRKVETILNDSQSGHEYKVIPWQQNEFIELMPMVSSIYNVILGIVMFIAGLVILNTMLMAVMERYHEIGVIKALGFKNRDVFFMVLAEAFYLGTIGAVLGGVLGGALSAYVEKVGIDFAAFSGGMMDKIDIPVPFYGRFIYPDFSFSILIGAMIFGILVTLLAVLYPAFKSAQMSPVEAFRTELKV